MRRFSGFDTAEELVLWINNDYPTHRHLESIWRNMTRKLAQDKFDHELAVKGFMWATEAGAKSYSKEFGGTWHQNFPIEIRRMAAEMLRDEFMAEVGAAPESFEKHVFKKDVDKWRERYPQRGAAVYPKDVAEEVSLSRPDLAAGDAIAAVLTWDPTLTADEVIEILDQSAADYRDDLEYDKRRGAGVRRAFRSGPNETSVRDAIRTIYDILDVVFEGKAINEWDEAYSLLNQFNRIVRDLGYQLDR